MLKKVVTLNGKEKHIKNNKMGYKTKSITSKASSACKINMGLVSGEADVSKTKSAIDYSSLLEKKKEAGGGGLVSDAAKLEEKTPLKKTGAWTRKEGQSETGGLNQRGVDDYKRKNPGSKLQTAVTTKPSKLKKGSKDAARRKSFCARMSGVKGPMKDEKGRPTRKALALKKWNC